MNVWQYALIGTILCILTFFFGFVIQYMFQKRKKNGSNGNDTKIEMLILKIKDEIKDLINNKIGSVYEELKDIIEKINNTLNKTDLNDSRISQIEKRVDQLERNRGDKFT